MRPYQSGFVVFKPSLRQQDGPSRFGIRFARGLKPSAPWIFYGCLWLLFIIAGSRQTGAAVPTNDVCSGAEIIPGKTLFPYMTAMTDITLCTTDGDPPIPSCAF